MSIVISALQYNIQIQVYRAELLGSIDHISAIARRSFGLVTKNPVITTGDTGKLY